MIEQTQIRYNWFSIYERDIISSNALRGTKKRIRTTGGYKNQTPSGLKTIITKRTQQPTELFLIKKHKKHFYRQ